MSNFKKWGISIMITIAMFLLLIGIVWLINVMNETVTNILIICIVLGIVTPAIKWTFFD